MALRQKRCGMLADIPCLVARLGTLSRQISRAFSGVFASEKVCKNERKLPFRHARQADCAVGVKLKA